MSTIRMPWEWASEIAREEHERIEAIRTGKRSKPEKQEQSKPAPASIEFKTWADVYDSLGPIAWDWPGWLPRGLLVILAARSGDGKSALALRIAGSYVMGWDWPDGTPFEGEPGCVVWAEAESAQAINIERARNWGLPMSCIIAPLPDPLDDVNFDLPEHRGYMTEAMMRPDVRFGVVDSLRGCHGGNENESDIEAIKFLASLARDSGKPILLIHHLRKRGQMDGDEITLDRLRGSSAIAQLARLIWAIDAPDPNDKEARRLSVIKSNLARFPEPIGMRITEEGVTFGDAPEAPKTETTLDRAIDLLLSLLARGPMPADELRIEFDMAGISWRTANEAKKRLRIVSVRRVDENNKPRWVWSLPVN